MNWPSDQPRESQLAGSGQLGHASEGLHSVLQGAHPGAASPAGPEIRVGKRPALVGGKEIEVFTMSLGGETIELLPHKNWAQLDLYKWRVRGRLPGTPAGLEIAADHTKLLGQTVSPKDPEACAKLEALFAEWLAMERETLELARKKAQQKAAPQQHAEAAAPEQQPMRFRVEKDKEDQVHIHCVKGKETLATIGLNPAGFQSLVSQGFMHKPHALKTGALHDWLEIDGVLYSFEKGNDDSAKLENALNASYLPPSSFGGDKAVVVYANAASSTGFDIQFPAKVGGTLENRRRPLGEDSLELLQDPEHCGLVRKGLVIKLSRPTFIFKQKTPDGGERYLDKCPENVVHVADDDGEEKLIDLSQPVNYLHLSAVELTAVFNHPSINRHAKAGGAGTRPAPAGQPPPGKGESTPPSQARPAPMVVQIPAGPSASPPLQAPKPAAAQHSPPPQVRPVPVVTQPQQPKPPAVAQPARAESPAAPVAQPSPGGSLPVEAKPPSRIEQRPNLWLKLILGQQPIRYDWLTCLIYEKIAAWARNSSQGKLLDCGCWFISLGDAEALEDPEFRGVFLTEKGGFGLLSGGYMIRLEQGTAFVGTPSSELKDSDVRLQGVGIDTEGRLVLIVNDGYRSKFGVPEETVTATLNELKEHGAELMSVQEVLDSPEPLGVVWTAPAEQANAAEPKALESSRPQQASPP